MDSDLVCNYKKCRKRLNTYAWVTSCSHIFCDEDGTKQFNKSYTCPACDMSLSGKFDIIRIDLQPSEQYKSMVLAGQKPETVMEICTRAMAFWTYQSHQEKTYQEFVANKAKEKMIELEHYYEQIITRTQTELSSLKTQLTATKKEMEGGKKKFNEVSEKLSDKCRQYQKLQSLYDTLRRKCITPSSFEADTNDAAHTPAIRHHGFMPIMTGDEILRHQRATASAANDKPAHYHGGGDQNRQCIDDNHVHSPPQREFILRPNSTPLCLIGANEPALLRQFHMGLGTPNSNANQWR